jgi:hypothetical protein
VNTTTRLAGFGVALVVALGAGAGLGAAIGPDAAPNETEAPPPIGEGVVSTADGYRIVPLSTALDADGGPFRFVINAPCGEPEHQFTPVHERDLHLIVVNRDLTSFDHVHPTLAADGTWSVDLPELEPGSYRAVADFMVTDGPRLALGTDLAVSGTYRPSRLDEPADTTTVDGYVVSLATKRGKGGEVTATLVVRKDGEQVDLEPYLGANGHLVAMRAGDLAYAHVHPVEDEDDPAQPGTVVFDATLGSEGRYGLFLDFKHEGAVRTAAFTFDQGVVTGSPEMEH